MRVEKLPNEVTDIEAQLRCQQPKPRQYFVNINQEDGRGHKYSHGQDESLKAGLEWQDIWRHAEAAKSQHNGQKTLRFCVSYVCLVRGSFGYLAYHARIGKSSKQYP